MNKIFYYNMSGSYTYTTNDAGDIIITGWEGSEKITKEMSSVEGNVIEIDDSAFISKDFTQLTNLNINDTVKTIGTLSYKDAIVPGTVNFDKLSLENIGISAFQGCTMLGEVDLSKSTITTIPDSCFYDCRNITSVKLPSTVTSIGFYGFKSCISIVDINIKDLQLTSIEAYAFDSCSSMTELDLSKSTITAIPDSCFYGCKGITLIKLPSTVTSVGSFAFNGCSGANINLSDISLQDGIIDKGLGQATFQNCSSMTELDLSKSTITAIPDSCFNNCNGITSVKLPSTVRSIGNNVFYGCSGVNTPIDLSDISLQDGIDKDGVVIFKGLGKSAFNGCTMTGEVDLSKSTITTIPQYCFSNCDNIDSIIFPSSLITIGNNAFSGCSGVNTHIDFSVTKLTDTFNDDNTLKTYGLGETAFQNCTMTGEVDLSNSTITTIQTNCFSNCINITSFKLPSTLKNISSNGISLSLNSLYIDSDLIIIDPTYEISGVVVYANINNTIKLSDNDTIKTFSPSFNALSDYFSYSRVYDYPYASNPTTLDGIDYYDGNSVFKPLYYTPTRLAYFYAYTPIEKFYTITITDSSGTVSSPLFTQTYDANTYLVTFSLIIESGTILTLSTNGISYSLTIVPLTSNNLSVNYSSNATFNSTIMTDYKYDIYLGSWIYIKKDSQPLTQINLELYNTDSTQTVSYTCNTSSPFWLNIGANNKTIISDSNGTVQVSAINDTSYYFTNNTLPNFYMKMNKYIDSIDIQNGVIKLTNTTTDFKFENDSNYKILIKTITSETGTVYDYSTSTTNIPLFWQNDYLSFQEHLSSTDEPTVTIFYSLVLQNSNEGDTIITDDTNTYVFEQPITFSFKNQNGSFVDNRNTYTINTDNTVTLSTLVNYDVLSYADSYPITDISLTETTTLTDDVYLLNLFNGAYSTQFSGKYEFIESLHGTPLTLTNVDPDGHYIYCYDTYNRSVNQKVTNDSNKRFFHKLYYDEQWILFSNKPDCIVTNKKVKLYPTRTIYGKSKIYKYSFDTLTHMDTIKVYSPSIGYTYYTTVFSPSIITSGRPKVEIIRYTRNGFLFRVFNVKPIFYLYVNDIPHEYTKNVSNQYLFKVNRGNYKIGISNTLTLPLTTINISLSDVSDICFVKDTLLKTDQGIVPIQNAIGYTIHKHPILYVTKTTHVSPQLVQISPYAFGSFPLKTTTMSLNHVIYNKGKKYKAKELVNGTTINLIPYLGEPLYNILCKEHIQMNVHGMIVESLNPKSAIGQHFIQKIEHEKYKGRSHKLKKIMNL